MEFKLKKSIKKSSDLALFGYSENKKNKSILNRYLERSRY